MTLRIEKDGMSYCIDLARAGSGESMEAILREDSDGWYIDEVTRARPLGECWYHRIGRRKSWQKALTECLELMEVVLVEREKKATK